MNASAGESPSIHVQSLAKPWLVISLCDGIGGLLLCLGRLQVRFDAVTAETDPGLRALVHLRFPNVEAYSDMHNINEDMIMKRARKKDYEGILLAGGPPCQPFSAAGLRQGWTDKRSSPTLHFCQLRRNLKVKCQ